MTDRSVLVRLKGDASDFNRAMVAARVALKGVRDEIDTTNDRTAWLAQGILAIGPTIAPIGAAATPVLTGLATQMTAVGLAAGATGLAFNGVGDALGALNDFQLEPTAANVEKLNEAMAKIGPDGAEFVRFLDSIGPQFAELANISRAGMFPGITEGIESFMDLMPQVSAIMREVSEGVGDLASNTGAGLNNERFAAFFGYLEQTAKPTLVEMGQSLGNLVEGFASLLVAFGPLSSDFSTGLMNMTDSFADWAANLSTTDGFAAFVEYIRESAPKVLDLLGSFSMALVEVLEAAAPIGDMMLPVLSSLFDIIGKLADTPLGPTFLAAAAAMSVYGRAAALSQITTGGLGKVMLASERGLVAQTKAANAAAPSIRQFGTALAFAGQGAQFQSEKTKAANAAVGGFVRSAAPAAGAAGLLALSMTGVADKFGLSNTTSLAFAGSLIGPWGAAVGGGVGLAMDFAAANNTASDSLAALSDNLRISKGRPGSADIEALTEQVRIAELRVSDFADMLNENSTNPFSLGAVKNQAEDIFGASDYDEAYAELQRLKAELEELKGAAEDAPDSYILDLRDEFAAAERAAESFTASFADLNTLLDQSGSLIAYEAALDAVTASIEENGNSWKVSGEAGRANLTSVNSLVEKAVNRSQALKEAGDDLGSQRILKRAIEDLQGFAGTSAGAREAMRPLIRALRELNVYEAKPKIKLSAEEAEAKAEKIRARLEKLGGMKPSPSVDAKIEAAQANLARVEAFLARLDGTTATTYVRTVRTGSPGPGPQDPRAQAFGGTYRAGHPLVRGYDMGDVRNAHQPQIAAGGEWRVWAEPETQGESYIPHANDGRRPRARAILEETAGILGARSVEWFADGSSGKDKDGKKRKPLNLESAGDRTPLDQMPVPAVFLAWAQAANDAADKAVYAARRQQSAADLALETAKTNDETADKALATVQASYDSVMSTTAGLFTIDPLAKPEGPSSIWDTASTIGDPFESLQDIIDRSTAFDMGSAALAARGLDGEALTYGLGSEERLAQLSAMSDADLARFEEMFNQAQTSVAATAIGAANLTNGPQLAAATATAAATEAVLQQSIATSQMMADQLDAANRYASASVGHLFDIANQISELGVTIPRGIAGGAGTVARRGSMHD